MRPRRLLQRLLDGNTSNVDFTDFLALVEAFGFMLDRIHASHYVYWHEGVHERLSLQSRKGEAKDYQVRDLLKLVEQYQLQFWGDDES